MCLCVRIRGSSGRDAKTTHIHITVELYIKYIGILLHLSPLSRPSRSPLVLL